VGTHSPAEAWKSAAAALLGERLGAPAAVLELTPTGGAFPDLPSSHQAPDEPLAQEAPAPTRIERAA
jgi:hypothetical protein